MPQDWFAQNAPKQAAQGDWFAQNSPQPQTNAMRMGGLVNDPTRPSVPLLGQESWGYSTRGQHDPSLAHTPGSQQALGALGSPVAAAMQPPQSRTEKFLMNGLGGTPVLPLIAKRMLIDPAVHMWEKANQTDGPESYGYRGAALIPGVGPMAGAAGESFGKGDNIGGAINAVGALAGAKGTAEQLRQSPKVLRQAAKTVVPDSTRTAIADKLRASAEKQYAKVLNPTTKPNKFLTQKKVAPGLVEREVVMTSPERLVEKAKANKQVASDNLEAVWENLPEDTKVEAKPLIDGLEKSKADFQNRISISDQEALKLLSDENTQHLVEQNADGKYVKVIDINPSAVSALNELQDMVRAHGDQIPAKAIRKVRQVLDKQVSRAGGFQGTSLADGSKLDAARDLTNLARQEIAKIDPAMREANAEFSFWQSVEQVASETKLRRVGQQGGLRKPIYRSVGTAAGSSVGAAIGGPVGAAVGTGLGYGIGDALARTEQSPAINTAMAIGKNRLSKAIRPTSSTGGAVSQPASAPPIPVRPPATQGAAFEQPKAMAAAAGAEGGTTRVSRFKSTPESLQDLQATYGVTETNLAEMAQEAGVEYKGLWDTSASRNGLRATIQDPQTGTSYTFPVEKMLEEGGVVKELEKARKRFLDAKAGKGQQKLPLSDAEEAPKSSMRDRWKGEKGFARLPLPKLSEAKTGKPFSAKLFRGELASLDEYTNRIPSQFAVGEYWSPKEEIARSYGSKLRTETVTLKNPYVLNLSKTAPYFEVLRKEFGTLNVDKITQMLKDKGHDGMIVNNVDVMRQGVPMQTSSEIIRFKKK